MAAAAMHQVRAVTLTGYLEVARFVGLDGRRMLRQAGISLEALEEPENRIPAAPIVRLFENSAEQSGCENFGLLMAEARSFASVGPLSLLLERLANAREIVNACMSFRRHLNDVVTIAMEDDGDTCLVRIDLEPAYWSVQVADACVAMAYRVLTHASGNRWHPGCVHLVRKAPSDMSPWRRFYTAELEFESGFNGMSASCASMLIPNPLADELMARHARHLLKLVPFGNEPGPASDRVRRVITLLLPSGRATLAQTSAQLGVSPRSLQRLLGEERHQFGDLLNAVRSELAVAYLTGSGHPVTSVAGMLGYASPSSFTRWFVSEFGMPPQVWRSRRRDGSAQVMAA